jgi:ATP-dependent helicase HrpA
MRSWECGTLPRVVERQWGANVVRGYPALADDGESVAVRVVATPEEQDATMWAGTRRLLLLTLPSPAKAVQRLLPMASQLALASPPHGSMAALLDDCTTAVVDDALADAGGPAWDEAAFDSLRESVRQDLVGRVLAAVEQVAAILAAADAIALRLDGIRGANLRPGADDVAAHVRRLVHPGFVTNVGVRRLADVLRYLRADERRLDRLAADPTRDRDRMQRLRVLERRFDDLVDRFAPSSPPPELVDVEWLLEELRVSYFAQGLGTAQQVSEKRIARELERLGG